MADEVTGSDKVPTPAVQDDKTGGSAVAADNHDGELILGKHKFKSLEDAGKSYEEAVADRTRKAQALHELQKKVEQLETQAQLAEKLEVIARNTAKPEGPTPWETYQKQLREELGEEDAKPALLALEMAGGWIGQLETSMTDRLQKQQEDYEKRLKELASGQSRMRPDYLENKEWVDKLTAGGMDFDKAVDMAKEFKAQMAPSNSDRITPPASIDSSRVGPSGGDQKASWFSQEDRAELLAAGVPEEQINAWEAGRKARIAAEQKVGAA